MKIVSFLLAILLFSEEFTQSQPASYASYFFTNAATKDAKGDFDGSIAYYSKTIDLNPNFVEAYFWRGVVKSQKGEVDDAMTDYNLAIKLRPDYALAYHVRGDAKRVQGDLAGAISDYTRIIEVVPADYLAYFNRGVACEIQGRASEAMTDYSTMIELEPEDRRFCADAYYNRGQLKYRGNDLSGAEVDYGKALALNFAASKKYVAYYALTNFLVQTEKINIVSDIMALKHNPFSPMNAKYARGDFDGALADYDKFIALKPDNAYAYQNRGRVKTAKNDLKGAFLDFNQAIEFKPDFAEGYFDRAIIEYLEGNGGVTLMDCTKAIELKPNGLLSFNVRGDIKNSNSNWDHAQADFIKAIELKPDFADAYNLSGIVKQAKGNLIGALVDYSSAIQLKPSFANAYYNRGLVEGVQRNCQRAIADYTKAIKLNPNFSEAYLYRGTCYEELAGLAMRSSEALADFNAAITIAPRFAEAYVSRAFEKKNGGDMDEALADYDMGIKIDPYNTHYYSFRAIVRNENNDTEGALADDTKAIELEPDNPQGYLNRGLAKQFSGDGAGARADYKREGEIEWNLKIKKLMNQIGWLLPSVIIACLFLRMKIKSVPAKRNIARLVWLLLAIFIVGLLGVVTAYSVQQKFDRRRLDIIHQCEIAMPVFARRYQDLDALFKLYENQDFWPKFISWPPTFIQNAATDKDPASFLTLPESGGQWGINEAKDHFTNGQTPFEKLMGALTVEKLLPEPKAFTDTFPDVKPGSLLMKCKADLAATDLRATLAINQIELAVVSYDADLSGNFFAWWLQIQPIQRDSLVVPPRP